MTKGNGINYKRCCALGYIYIYIFLTPLHSLGCKLLLLLTCTLHVAHSWPLHYSQYILLTIAPCTLSTPNTCILYSTQTWPLHTTPYPLLTSATCYPPVNSVLCTFPAPEPCSLYVTHSWPLYFTCCPFLTPKLCTLPSPDLHSVWYPLPTLHFVHYLLLTPALHI